MQTIGSQPTKTFSIGFPETDFDQAPYARAVAAHLGTDHTELYVDARDALALIPELTTYYDEPFADSSQIPTLLVSRLTRRHVAVVLSGDGGDELFGGYTRYRTGAMLARRLRLLPPGTRGFAGTLLRTLPERFWDAAFRLMPQRLRVPQAGRKIHKLADGLRMLTPDAMYRRILSQWPEPDAIVVGGREHRGALWDPDLARIFPDFLDRIQISDTLTYLPDDILTKIDRPSMAYGLEARVPLLDHRLVEFAWRSPAPFKIRGNVSKWSLRQILYRYIPAHLVDRPKMGFGVPLDNWLRGDLRAWADSLLASERLARQGLLRVRPVRDMWETHVAGENWAYPIWNVLILRDSLSHHNVQ